METLTTTDYSIFKTMEGNRSVPETRVKKLMDSIQEIGWVSQPILVNENMEVGDGQGRLEALKRLGLPVEYRIIKGLNIRQCRVLNSANTSWDSREFIKSYADAGNEHYKRLWQLMTMYGVDARTVMRLGNIYFDIGQLKRGEFVFERLAFGKACKRLPIYCGYMGALKRFGGHGGAKKVAVYFLIEGSYPHDNIVNMLTTCDISEISTVSTERLLQTIEETYNKYKRDDNRIYPLEDYRRSQK